MDKSLTIQSGNGEYQVIFREKIHDLISFLVSSDVSAMAVVDHNVNRLYPTLIETLRKSMPILLLEATEESKTLLGAEKVLRFLSENNATKSTILIAIGGGIIQDIASFAAHIYYRGLNFIFVPTTLLAMSDSCIGAKCGLNYLGFKNQIGAFHPPKKVFICIEFLRTLSDADLYSGYGEIFKLSLTGEQTAWSYSLLKAALNQYGLKNPDVTQHIFQSLAIKKKFIEEDEFDAGIRKLLNYGHTFGHALELATNYTIPHGMAVARGIDVANFIAYQLGLLDQKDYIDIHEFTEIHFHGNILPSVTAEMLIGYAKKDKKVSGNKLNMVLLQKPGFLVLKELAFDGHLHDILKSYLDSNPNLYQG